MRAGVRVENRNRVVRTRPPSLVHREPMTPSSLARFPLSQNRAFRLWATDSYTYYLLRKYSTAYGHHRAGLEIEHQRRKGPKEGLSGGSLSAEAGLGVRPGEQNLLAMDS